MSRKRFVTLFPFADNQLLVKDVGQIPYILGKYYKYQATLASRDLDLTGEYVNDIKDGLTLQKYKKVLNSWKLDAFIFLFFNSKKIDWLNIYHCNKKSYYWSKWYKFLNPEGKVYLKLDMDFRNCETLDINKRKRKLFKKLTEYEEIVSVENQSVKDRIQNYTKKELLVIQNGCLIDCVRESEIKKEDVFLTVGRLGTEQKATEVLLQAFALYASKHNWKLKLVGPIQENFKEYIENYFKIYPELKQRVEFIGMVKDRTQISKFYQEAKAFVLPSRWESFGLVLPEAVCNGCYIMTTENVPSAEIVTHKGEFGEILDTDNIEKWGEALYSFTQRKLPNDYLKKEIDYGKKTFSWKEICKELDYRMEEIDRGV